MREREKEIIVRGLAVRVIIYRGRACNLNPRAHSARPGPTPTPTRIMMPLPSCVFGEAAAARARSRRRGRSQ